MSQALMIEPVSVQPFNGLTAPTVLQVIPELETGGAERTTVDIAKAVIDAGGRSIVVSHGGRLLNELDEIGATHITLPVHSKNPLTMWSNIRQLSKIIREHEVTIVHARSRAPAWSSLAAARRCGVHFVTTYHGKVHDGPNLKILYNSVMTRGDAVISNSEFTTNRIMQFHKPSSPVYTIQRGSDLERFNPQNLSPGAPEAMRVKWGVPANVPCFMLPARLTRWKGHFVALHALQRIAQETPAHLVLVGDPQGRDSYLMELEAGVQQAGLAGRVHLVGHCDDMPTAYAAADFILAPSIEPEPFGRTPIEAAAMGRLVIVSNHGGACETVLTDYENPGQATGWRVTPGIIREVAEAMRAALALSVPERDAMGRRARNRVMSQFSLSAMCDATLQVYSDLLRG